MCYLANLGMTARDAPRPDWTAAEVGGDDMTFKGVLSPDELSRLDIMYGDLVIVPGHCGSYGKKSDRQGIVRIPGSLTSFREANKRFKGWANKNDETDRLQWWLGQLQRRGGDVIKVSTSRSTWRLTRGCALIDVRLNVAPSHRVEIFWKARPSRDGSAISSSTNHASAQHLSSGIATASADSPWSARRLPLEMLPQRPTWLAGNVCLATKSLARQCLHDKRHARLLPRPRFLIKVDDGHT